VENEMEIIGVKDEMEFLIRLWSQDDLLTDVIIIRSYSDLFHLSKQISSSSTAAAAAAGGLSQVSTDANISIEQLVQFPSAHCKKLLKFGDWDLVTKWNPYLTKSLNILNQWLRNARKYFPLECQKFYDELLFSQEMMRRKERKAFECSARGLQQYFMSDENMNRLITETLRYYLPNCLFIEPSCGDGRLLRRLLKVHSQKSLEERQEKREMVSFSVCGCDIDPNVVQRCLQLDNNKDEETKGEGEEGGGSLKDKIHVGNFLETTLETFFSKILSPVPISAPVPPSPSRVIVFGGPPYTCGGGTGQLSQSGDSSTDTGRDLPLQFIIHSAVTLRAHAIIFLLPVRCQNEEFIQRCRSLIEEAEQQQQEQSRPQARESEIEKESPPGADWIVSHVSPPNNEFDFCSRIIRQPVIIQIWERR
jgi:hypothetical protein